MAWIGGAWYALDGVMSILRPGLPTAVVAGVIGALLWRAGTLLRAKSRLSLAFVIPAAVIAGFLNHPTGGLSASYYEPSLPLIAIAAIAAANWKSLR